MLFGTTRDHSLLTGYAQDDTSLQREDKQQREGRTFVCVNTLTLPLFLLKKGHNNTGNYTLFSS